MADRRLISSTLLVAAMLTLTSQVSAQPYDHPLFTGPTHTPRIQRFDQEHLRLALAFDVATGSIHGDARFRLAPVGSTFQDTLPAPLFFHTAGLTIDSVRIGETIPTMREASFRSNNTDSLVIAFDSLYVPGDPFEVRIHYQAQPRQGLFFADPGNATPPVQLWTEQRPGSTRHWIPILDGPGDMMTTELLITVDSSQHVLSNGRLVEVITHEDGTATSYYRQEQRHALNRLMIAAGAFDVHEQASTDPQVPLSYWLFPGQADAIARTWDGTQDIIQFFSQALGVVYPWDSYTHVVLPHFHDEGQATTGIAAFPDYYLRDERAALSTPTDTAPARTVARQWFGGFVQAKSYTDSWLDEGFATYLGALFTQHQEGRDAFSLAMLQSADHYFEEAIQYRRPLRWNRWQDPSEMVDAHSVHKGARVLHQLHRQIGDEAFWEVAERYLRTNAYNLSETSDLQSIIESVTRKDFELFFAQWIEGAGHPVLRVTYTYDSEDGMLSVTVDQRQEGFRVPEAFQIPLWLEVQTLTRAHRFELTLEAPSQTFTVPLAERPRYVLIDPDHEVLAEVALEQTARAWVGQLRLATDPVSRILAARALASFADDPAILVGVRSALREERHPAVRKAIAETVRQRPPTTASQRLLIEMTQDDDASVRGAALEGLALFTDNADIHDIAFKAAQDDPSYAVQATAVKTLAQTNSPIALDVIRSALITPSHREVIRRAAFEALAVLEIPTVEALSYGLDYSTEDHPGLVRIAALRYLSTSAPESREALRRLVTTLEDRDTAVRKAAIESLAQIGTNRALEALEQHLETEAHPQLQTLVRRVLDEHAERNQQ